MSIRKLLLTTAILSACTAPSFEGEDVALSDGGATNPTVAMDARTGAAYAAWIETDDAGSNVFLAVLDSTGRGEHVRVNDIDGDAAPHDQAPPQVAVAPDGTVYVVWQNNTHVPGRRFPASNLRIARSTDGGRSFESAVYVNDDAHGLPSSHTFQDIAVVSDGTVYVSWIDGRTRTQSEVRVAKSVDGGRTFTPGVVVHPNVCPCCRTSIAVARDGTVAVSFRLEADDIRDIAVVRSTDGGATFGEPIVVHEDGWRVEGCPHAGASLAFDGSGRMHIAWYTGSPERQGLWYAASNADGTTFGTPEPLQTGGWVPVSQVKLAIAADDAVWIAWDDRREEQSQVRLAVRNARAVSPSIDVNGRSPAIAAGRDVVFAWQHGDSATARIVREQ